YRKSKKSEVLINQAKVSKIMTNKLIFFILTLNFSELVSAEDKEKVELEPATVVAIANKQIRPIQDVIGDVSLINSDQLESRLSEDMASALKYESSIFMEDAGTRFGSSGINIRGIGKNRVAIEVDGTPSSNQFSIGSYSHATSVFPDISLIKSIEVLNGPASTLYGSDAIGGVVSIRTWNPEDLTRLTDSNHFSKLRLGYEQKNHSRSITGLSAWDNDNNGVLISFTQRDGKGLIPHGSVHDKRDFSDWGQQTLFTKFVHATNQNNNLVLSFRGQQRDSTTQINSFIGIERFARTTGLYAEDNNNDKEISLNYDFGLNSRWFDSGVFHAYYADTDFKQDTFENRNSRTGTPLFQFRNFEYSQSRHGVEINLHKSINFDNATHNLIYGVEFSNADISELRDGFEANLQTGVTIPAILSEFFPRRDFPNSNVKELGVFFMNEIVFDNDKWVLIPALRFDRYKLNPTRDEIFDANGTDTEIVALSETDFSPKLGVLYNINNNSNIYLQYVRGFRAPPFDDVNIGLNIPMLRIRAIANPDLKSEHSDGFEIGYRYFSDSQQLKINTFYTDYRDFIETKARIGIDPDTGYLLFQSRNIDKAEIYGIEIDYLWMFHPQMSAQINWAWTDGKNKTTDEELESISPSKAVLNFNWHSIDNDWNADLYVVHNNRHTLEDTALFQTPANTVVDMIVNKDLKRYGKVSLGIYNIFNKKYWNWQQVRNFDVNDQILASLTQPSRNVSFAYSYEF
ncbi:MAG TPA: TonB-dependent hemoglobin/transferrin/lactoferrin family receptor, partial [Gammaproteobacteria bacterium]|nr:TonB-dependent hemoglobin/transferrin/lactoferrin family receptor [Gammaproteobacteria bacterium]HPI96980.1 TonB-dependent hemoglobin/transferrin/lactoferrin family receptor [Gammaproteobacteria bacterium]